MSFFSTLLRTPHNAQSIHSSLQYSKMVRDLYGWVSNVINCHRPFSVVENRDVREHLRYERISLNTFERYMSLLMRQVKNNISEMLQDKSILASDGQSTLEEHYVGTLVLFPTYSVQGFTTVCFALYLSQSMRLCRKRIKISASWRSCLVSLVSARIMPCC